MQSLFLDLDSTVKASVKKGKFTDALESLKQFVVTMMNEESTPGEVVGARKLDELCELVGNTYFNGAFPGRQFKADEKRIVIVCTGLYKYGGTTLLISDIAKAHPGYECTVIATNYLDNMTDEDLHLSRIGDSGAEVSICPKGDAKAKMHWLMQQFLELAPSRIFLLNHHQDSPMIAAAAPLVDQTKVLFYHHADYNICLGVHLKGAVHVDPHNVGFYNCRVRESIRDNVYIPMVVEDQQVNRVGECSIAFDALTTCSSGSFHKFRNFYLYPYVDFVAQRLRARRGQHIHIGGIPDGELASILTELGDNASRFVHIPWAASLWETLVEKEVDLFIGSFPIGGARTTIEAMGAGIPLLMPENYLSRFFSSRDIVYAEAFTWKTGMDFWHVLRELTPEKLADHSALSRAHYLAQYSPQAADMERKFNAICAGEAVPPAYKLYPHEPDMLDRAMHFARVQEMRSGYAVQAAMRTAKRSPLARAFSGLLGRRRA